MLAVAVGLANIGAGIISPGMTAALVDSAGPEHANAAGSVLNANRQIGTLVGIAARISRTDRQPHLARADAHALLLQALDAYRREHHTAPARIVLHKTSAFTGEETGGFQDAADERFIDTLEMSWVTSSAGAATFRPGDAPPLRGTLAVLGERELTLYATGSIEFYRTYPGMYIPRPIGIRPVTAARDPRELAAEVLALTTMNWNQTRLDGSPSPCAPPTRSSPSCASARPTRLSPPATPTTCKAHRRSAADASGCFGRKP